MVMVKMLVSMGGPAGTYGPGDTYECQADEAARLIAAGYAEPIPTAKIERAVKPAGKMEKRRGGE